MKLDMHCHTKEGSIDAKVPIQEYITKLVKEGFDGMLVTDHNSYDGYRKFEKIAKNLHLEKPFTVLKGIEYDTRDGGHVIAVLPDCINDAFMEIRGMTLAQLEKIVHERGGILGLAHPYGPGFFAFTNTRFGKKHNEFLEKFDFVETFNACTRPWANACADNLAGCLHKPKVAGSDAHKMRVVGAAYTEFTQKIANNNDLIRAIKEGWVQAQGGSVLKEMEEERQRLIHEAQKNKENDIEDRDSFCGKKVIRSGSGEVYFTNVTLKDKEEKLQNVYKSHDFMQVQYDFVNKSDIEEAVFSVRIYKDDNTHCYGTTSDIECNDTIKIKGKNKFIVDFDDLCLLDGNYMIDVDVKDKTGDIVYDSIHDTIRFDVINEDGRTGVCAIRTSWKVE